MAEETTAPKKPTAADREASRLAAIQATHDREPSTSEVLTRIVRLEKILEADSKKSMAELYEATLPPEETKKK